MSEIEVIEQLIQQRKVRRAKANIAKWLRRNSTSANHLLAIDWYRRLSLYSDGLHLVMRINPFDTLASKKVKLAAADLLSHVGAISYALQLLSELNPETADEFEIAGGIYFSANNYDKALEFFDKRIAMARNQQEYAVRLSRLTRADCIARLGNPKQGIQLVKELLTESSEQLFHAICTQAIGEYLVYEGKYAEALSWLLDSKTYFPGEEETYDLALLFRWLGFVYCKLGKSGLGRNYLERSSKIIRVTGLGDYVWLENLKLKKELKLLRKNEELRFHIFSGLASFGAVDTTKSLSLLSAQNKIQIHFGSNEYLVDKKIYLGIPLEIKVLGFLKVVGPWGIDFESVKTVIWPNEGKSYLQLESRLRQILKIVKKKYFMDYVVKNKRISLSEKSLKQIGITISDNAAPTKIKSLSEFTRKDLQTIYNLKKAQAALWLRHLEEKKLIVKQGRGPLVKYRSA